MDLERENIAEEVVYFCHNHGTLIKPSPSYGPESNEIAERLVLKHWTRARVFISSTGLPKERNYGDMR